MGTTERDEWVFKLDLLSRLISKGVVRPNRSVSVSTIRNWFPTRERDVANAIVESFVDDPAAPIEYTDTDRESIWITDLEEARAFKREIDENPDWFRP